MSAADVVGLARAEGLADVAEDLAGCVRPGWRIVPSGERAPSGVSKVGGSPDLADGESWPLSARGIPMGFVAQIDCRAIPPLPVEWEEQVRAWRHGSQLVRLFINVLDNWELGPACALACDPRLPLTRTTAPPIPDPWPAGGSWDSLHRQDRSRLYVLPETAVGFEPFLTAPETHPVLRRDLQQFDEGAERYLQWLYRLRIDGAPNDAKSFIKPWEVHHLLGEPISVQDDIRSLGAMLHQRADEWAAERAVPADPALGDEAAWQVLLGLHMDDRLRLEIFDGGAIQILAPVADLADGRLDRLVYGISSG
ncbi:MAG: DUF1963 domain-containing protein [Thermoleophilaceae bacterium]